MNGFEVGEKVRCETVQYGRDGRRRPDSIPYDGIILQLCPKRPLIQPLDRKTGLPKHEPRSVSWKLISKKETA